MQEDSRLSSRLERRLARLWESGNLGWSLGALIISLIAIAPLIAIAALAAQSSGDTWPHLIANVLPGALKTTFLLMLGVGTLTLVIGTGTAWLVTMYRFPGSRILAWLLLLPLAMPTYIIAFCFLELFDYSGVLQTTLRSAFGWNSAKDYWFPDIRSLGGAIFFIGAVLYPYVYVTARASFLGQSVCVLEVARTLGRSATSTFWEVALPLARPALAAGVALALMETLNDIGAVSFFGVRTLTVAIYDTWLDRNSLAGAAQIAGVMLIFVFALLLIERASRAKRRFHHTTGKYRRLPEEELRGFSGALATLACALPVLIGFVLPAGVLVRNAIAHLASGLNAEFWESAWHSLMLATAAAIVAVSFACILGYASRQTKSKLIHGLSALASISYAVPGTVLAIGILIPLAGLDNWVDGLMRSLFGISTGLALSGTGAVIVLAYAIRFLAASLGAVEAGLSKVSRNIDAAARTLGATVSGALWNVHLPLLRPALGAAALLVFVDSMKELPATLLLRPFNFDTLATQVFTLASLYRYEEAGLSALTIVATSLVPLLMLHGLIVAGRPGASPGRGTSADRMEALAILGS
ncbi:MAG: iron ABC transporter permease [Methyloceanibacter sp.]|jgi:iron(III) transport system permease protein|nr:iron ABC transporter permease [Methyloceanibacter sp.]